MTARWSRILLLIGWLLATGSHWDVVQVCAWARMLAHNAQEAPWSDALAQTFDPQEMCDICVVVHDAKRQDDSLALPVPGARGPLIFSATASPIVAAPREDRWLEQEWIVPERERSAPPSPPPRVFPRQA